MSKLCEKRRNSSDYPRKYIKYTEGNLIKLHSGQLLLESRKDRIIKDMEAAYVQSLQHK